MKAGTMCEFSKKEFIEGLQSLGYEFFSDFERKFVSLIIKSLMKVLSNYCRIDSLEKFREKIPYMRSELKDERMDNTHNSIQIMAWN